VALAVDSDNCPADDDGKIGDICNNLRLRFDNSPKGPRLCMNGTDISDRIRTQEITMLASALSARAVVREYLLGVQREMAAGGGVVFEGRDMGTVVFPDADIKFFLDADFGIRTSRRHTELLATSSTISLNEVAETMNKRDHDDSSRALAPLKPAHDAIRIDSSSLGIHEVVDVLLGHITALLK
jgi:cytidylate kinase